jgi:hypothetical protein
MQFWSVSFATNYLNTYILLVQFIIFLYAISLFFPLQVLFTSRCLQYFVSVMLNNMLNFFASHTHCAVCIYNEWNRSYLVAGTKFWHRLGLGDVLCPFNSFFNRKRLNCVCFRIRYREISSSLPLCVTTCVCVCVFRKQTRQDAARGKCGKLYIAVVYSFPRAESLRILS